MIPRITANQHIQINAYDKRRWSFHLRLIRWAIGLLVLRSEWTLKMISAERFNQRDRILLSTLAVIHRYLGDRLGLNQTPKPIVDELVRQWKRREKRAYFDADELRAETERRIEEHSQIRAE